MKKKGIGCRFLAAALAVMTVFSTATTNVSAAEFEEPQLLEGPELSDEIETEDPEELEESFDAEPAAVKRFKFSYNIDKDKVTFLEDDSLSGVEKIGGAYYIEKDETEIEASFKLADGYYVDKEKSNIEVLSAGEKYTFYHENFWLDIFKYDVEKHTVTVAFDFGEVDLDCGGDLKINLVTCSAASDHTVTCDNGITVEPGDPEKEPGAVMVKGVCHILRYAEDVDLILRIPAGKVPTYDDSGNMICSVLYNNSLAEKKFYSVSYDETSSFCDFNFKFPVDEEYADPILADIRISIPLEKSDVKSKYTVKWSGNVKPDEQGTFSGILGKKDSGSYYIDPDSSYVSMNFDVAEGYTVKWDDKGPIVKVNDKRNDNIVADYSDGSLYVSYSFPTDEKQGDYKVESLNIAVSTVSKKTENTFSVASGSASILSIAPETKTEGTNIIYSGGKYYLQYLDECENETEVFLNVAPEYAGIVNAADIEVYYGSQKLEDDYCVSNVNSGFSVKVNRYYYDEKKEEEVQRTGNIVVKCNTDDLDRYPVRTKYTISFGPSLIADESGLSSMVGVDYDKKTGKFYILKGAERVNILLKQARGYAVDFDAAELASVTYGGKKCSTDDYMFGKNADGVEFYMDLPTTKDDKISYGDIVVKPALRTLAKVEVEYNADQLEVDHFDDVADNFVSADHKFFYVPVGEDLRLDASCEFGYYIDCCKVGDQVITGPNETEDPQEHSGEVYTFENVTKDMKVTIITKSQDPMEIKTVIVDWQGNAEKADIEFVSGVTRVGDKVFTNNEDVVFKIIPPKVKTVLYVDYYFGKVDRKANTTGVYEPEADGTFIIPEEDVRYNTQIEDSLTIYITIDDKPVPVYVKVNDKLTNDKEVPGLLDVDMEYGTIFNKRARVDYTEPGINGENEIEFEVRHLSEATVVDSVLYKVDNGQLTAPNIFKDKSGNDHYRIEDSVVKAALKNQQPITIEIKAHKKDPKNVTFLAHKGVTYKLYNSDGSIGKVLKDVEAIDYGTALKVVAVLDPESAKTTTIAEARFNGKIIKAKTDGKLQYYDLGKVKDTNAWSFEAVTKTKREYKKLNIVPDSHVDLKISVDGEYLSSSDSVTLLNKSAVTLKLECDDNYKVSKVTAANGTKLTVKGSTVKISSITNDETITITTAPKTTVYAEKDGEKTKVTDKKVLNMTTDEEMSVFVRKGDSKVKIKSVAVTNIGQDKGFAKISGSGAEVLLSGKAAVGATKNITVSFMCEGESKARQATVFVKQPGTKVTVKGFKNGQVSQPIGTTVNYKVELDSNKDYEGMRLSLNSSSSHIAARFDSEKKLLTVDTFENVFYPKANESVELQFKDREGNNLGAAFVVTAVKGSLDAPAVKLSEATDRTVTLSMGLPKGASKYTDLYYEISAVAVAGKNGQIQPGMKKEVRLISPVSEKKVVLSLSDEKSGNGQKYKVSARLIQADSVYSSNYEITENDIITAGKKASIEVSTKKPCYEKKLSLNKKKTTFTVYEENVLLATASFSKDTSYTSIAKAELIPAGEKAARYDSEGGSLTVSGKEISIKDTDFFTPGKYTLKVYAVAPEGKTGASASLPVTVNAPVTDIRITGGSDRLYKANGKAATIKLGTECTSHLAKNGKPASGKVTWSVYAENKALQKALSIKDGTVTVAKSYILSSSAADNTFTVTAMATDLGKNNSHRAEETMDITLTKEKLSLARIRLKGVPSLQGKLSAKSLKDCSIVVTDIYYKDVDSDHVTITVKGGKGLKLSRDGKILSAAPGTYTITAKANDGSGSSCTRKITVKK